MSVLIINNAEPIDRAFNQPLFDTFSAIVDTYMVEYATIPSIQHIAALYDAAIISGVPLHYDANTILSRRKYFQWIVESDIPVLGICLGHQNIAALYGTAVNHGIEAENGTIQLQTLTSDPIFDGMSERFEVEALHSCSVGLPTDFKLLARSDTCTNQIMKHVYKDIYGFQFHPELSSTGRMLLRNFLAIAAK